jgi:hypothetical protein
MDSAYTPQLRALREKRQDFFEPDRMATIFHVEISYSISGSYV